MRYTNLQAGRFAAAAAVLVFHAAFLSHKQLGLPSVLIEPIPSYLFGTSVVFFFALSGFVLALGLQRATLGGFLRSRLVRLYPAYWLATGIVIAVRAMAGHPLPFDNKGLFYSLTLWPTGPHRASFALGVEWSLVYEMFLSIALIPFAALGRRWGLGLGAAAWLALIVGRQVATGGTVFHQFPRYSEIPLSAMNTPFLLGVLVYLGSKTIANVRRMLPVVAVAALGGGAALVQSAVGWSILLQSLGTAAAVGYFAGGRQLAEGNRLVRAGDWSYGIYLMHVPVLAGFYTLAAGALSYAVAISLLGALVALAIGCAFGSLEWALYRRLRAGIRLFHSRPAASRPIPIEAAPVRRAA